MMLDARSFLRFAIKTIAIGGLFALVISFVAVLGFAAAWHWPLNAIATLGLCLLAYCWGRADEREKSRGCIDMIAPLPGARLERRRRR